MHHIHNKDVELMVWETNPEKRKKNTFPVNMNVVKKRDLSPGDKIILQDIQGQVYSIYVIEEIKNRRASSISKYDYVETLCSWTRAMD